MFRRFAALLGFAALVACSGSDSPTTPPPPQPAAVDVSADSVTVRQLTSATLSATVRDQTGKAFPGATVTWSSARPEVVSVDGAGTLTTGRPGVAWVTASYGALKDSVRVRVSPLWKRVSVGHRAQAACGLSTDGYAFCWGTGGSGELGSLASSSQVPVPVQGGHRFVEIAVGFRSVCALEEAGTPWCWGDGSSGQLGNGRESGINSPRAVPGTLYLASIVAGEAFYCGAELTGALYCWGNNHDGELGIDPVATEVAAPGRFHATLGFSRVSGGATHLCGLTFDGRAYCWGTNALGQLGTGDRDDWRPPTEVLGVPSTRAIGAGSARSCALDGSGAPYCWGGSTFSPAPLATDVRLATLSTGDQLWCGRTAAGETWCGTTSLALVQTQQPFTRVEVGGLQACGITTLGELYCWGPNASGALGTGDFADHPSPTRVVDPD
ncbi:MAG: hypothetical protein ACJ8J0_06340 [Longimicrobiaceae bacterium]